MEQICQLVILSIIIEVEGCISPWHQISYWAAIVLTSIVNSLPIFGRIVYKFAVGGFAVSSVALVRALSARICLGFIILGFMVVHVFYIHKKGRSKPFPDALVDIKVYLEAGLLNTPVSIRPERVKFFIYHSVSNSLIILENFDVCSLFASHVIFMAFMVILTVEIIVGLAILTRVWKCSFSQDIVAKFMKANYFYNMLSGVVRMYLLLRLGLTELYLCINHCVVFFGLKILLFNEWNCRSCVPVAVYYLLTFIPFTKVPLIISLHAKDISTVSSFIPVGTPMHTCPFVCIAELISYTIHPITLLLNAVDYVEKELSILDKASISTFLLDQLYSINKVHEENRFVSLFDTKRGISDTYNTFVKAVSMPLNKLEHRCINLAHVTDKMNGLGLCVPAHYAEIHLTLKTLKHPSLCDPMRLEFNVKK
ncbi:unnamed protein product [Taenia asiatica]|uniref:Cytochrome b n=1 Tax=Taenia asiatica TaxID=60517 RepID=A0A0R3WAL4_TAEAS|nr:unnamed protein product [Taenia asiatica]